MKKLLGYFGILLMIVCALSARKMVNSYIPSVEPTFVQYIASLVSMNYLQITGWVIGLALVWFGWSENLSSRTIKNEICVNRDCLRAINNSEPVKLQPQYGRRLRW